MLGQVCKACARCIGQSHTNDLYAEAGDTTGPCEDMLPVTQPAIPSPSSTPLAALPSLPFERVFDSLWLAVRQSDSELVELILGIWPDDVSILDRGGQSVSFLRV